MFDMFWKPKYYTKCKTCAKLLKSRLDSIRKKKNAVLKYLKGDIVELLKSRLDYNAYNRAEGFLAERNVMRCYDLIDEFCGTIITHISALNKQSECPDECKEAVGSLIYAAARFSDLPELRDLRGLFTGKYGSSFESSTNNELIEKSKVVTVTKEIKLELLQEIAQGSAIDWNSKALEQQLYTPPPNELVGDRKSIENKNKTKVDFVPVHESKTSTLVKKDNSDDDSMFDGTSEGNTTEPSTGDSSSTDQDLRKGISEDEVEEEKPFYLRVIRPPYLKEKPTNRETMEEARKATIHIENVESIKQQPKPTSEEKPKPRSVRRRNAKLQPGRNISIDINDGAERISSSGYKGKETMIGEEKGVWDEEEKMLDGLLMHYSNKKTNTQESNQAKDNLKFQIKQEKDNVEQDTKTGVDFSPARDSTEPTKPVKRNARSNSFVHPKLPDYDQLAARFAALKEEK